MDEASQLLLQASAARDPARMARRVLQELARPQDRAKLEQYADELEQRAAALEQEVGQPAERES